MTTVNIPDEAVVGVSRRQLLKRGALVAGATVWTVPLIQAVSMTPAHADTTSGVPVDPPGTTVPTTTVPPTTTQSTTPPPGSTTTTPGSSTKTRPGSTGIDATHAGPGGVNLAAHGSGAGGSGDSAASSSKPLAYTGVAFPIAPTVAVGLAAVALGAGAAALGRSNDDGGEETQPSA